ncbi:MAG: DNA recombination protein RmuC [Smithellaceae bacterium]|nr:DNA recombination protein RmuC [Smithellaceae bacterium]
MLFYGIFLFLLIVLVLVIWLVLRNLGAAGRFDGLEKYLERIERAFREEVAQNREEATLNNRQQREELSCSIRDFASIQKSQLDIFAEQLKALSTSNESRLEKMRDTVEVRLKELQSDNNLKLEQMRAVVDEKLHDTLEKRLGESFKLVSERLELVHKGLGEMQTLASGVGDLKKVLTNVKTRGTFGEIQLGNLLEQILAPEQYEANVVTKKGSANRVEFAIKFPGRGEPKELLWLPIDAKFPQEDYLRLLEAQEKGNPLLVDDASRQLERAIKEMAKNIRDKYLDPPHTTDFALMFLPTEGLYAEVLRRTGLFEQLQREYRVNVTGPTTLAAFLNSLQMGFRTLAIEKRSSEVWTLLGTVKTEFSSFGLILEKTQKKLQEASNTIDVAARRSRVIERKLKTVQGIPSGEEVQSGEALEDEP